MPISKQRAETAIKALQGGGVTALTSLGDFNQHIVEKHFSKGTALAAAQANAAPQGYFKRGTNVEIALYDDFRAKGVTRKDRLQAVTNAGYKSIAEVMMKKPANPFAARAKTAAAMTDWSEIAWGVINSTELTLHASTANAERNFMAIAPIPSGFYGRAIDQEGTKNRNVNKAIVVIDAGVTTCPQVVTIYPAGDAYVASRPELN
jgi:hypothetical protein